VLINFIVSGTRVDKLVDELSDLNSGRELVLLLRKPFRLEVRAPNFVRVTAAR